MIKIPPFYEVNSFNRKMASTWRNFKNIFSRPLFTIIFRPVMLKNAKISHIYHFDTINIGGICHILCVNLKYVMFHKKISPQDLYKMTLSQTLVWNQYQIIAPSFAVNWTLLLNQVRRNIVRRLKFKEFKNLKIFQPRGAGQIRGDVPTNFKIIPPGLIWVNHWNLHQLRTALVQLNNSKVSTSD